MGGNEKFVIKCLMKTLGRRNLSEGYDIKMDPLGIGFEDKLVSYGKIWEPMTAFVTAVNSLLFPQNVLNFLES